MTFRKVKCILASIYCSYWHHILFPGTYSCNLLCWVFGWSPSGWRYMAFFMACNCTVLYLTDSAISGLLLWADFSLRYRVFCMDPLECIHWFCCSTFRLCWKESGNHNWWSIHCFWSSTAGRIMVYLVGNWCCYKNNAMVTWSTNYSCTH